VINHILMTQTGAFDSLDVAAHLFAQARGGDADDGNARNFSKRFLSLPERL